jgi:hypothetical protein
MNKINVLIPMGGDSTRFKKKQETVNLNHL